MDHIKIFAKNGKEQETLPQAFRIYCQDIGMEFGTEKSAMLIMENRKRETTKGIELPNQENIRTLEEKENYKYLEIL